MILALAIIDFTKQGGIHKRLSLYEVSETHSYIAQSKTQKQIQLLNAPIIISYVIIPIILLYTLSSLIDVSMLNLLSDVNEFNELLTITCTAILKFLSNVLVHYLEISNYGASLSVKHCEK